MNEDLTSLDQALVEKAESWTKAPYDETTRQEVLHMIQNDPQALKESFYKDLEFGTGGLRGIMGAGSNRMNRYTVGAATQGFANYLRESFGEGEHGVAIAHDCRNNSREFAEETADILASNGFQVHLFKELRPTPQLSYAVRSLGCKGGIVITASHNPPAYNGYKVYWEDGGQIVTPHDKAIIARVRAIADQSEVKRSNAGDRIQIIGDDMDDRFLQEVEKNVIEQEVIASQANLPIVYTGLHGTGITLIPDALKRIGFNNVQLVEEQAVVSGEFPTVESPNPEEAEALSMGVALAEKIGAEIVLGTDPDTDRVGIACRNDQGSYDLLNGNDTGVLLTWYQLSRLKAKGELPSNAFVAKTIVTTPLIEKIADHFGIPCYETLTGFKWIADKIREKEPEEKFITGGEESYGYMIGDFVRDKDGVSAATMICEMTAWFKSQGMSIPQALASVHKKLGVYREALVSLKKEGISGAEEIQQMMQRFRNESPSNMAGIAVSVVIDYLSSEVKYLNTDTTDTVNQPPSNVVQFVLEDDSIVTARPSGTEPKIKFYFSVNEAFTGDYDVHCSLLEQKIEQLKEAFLAS
ncbi:MAG: phospho-sugar mutase [Flavobacteriales bacterium]|nr:phospho-sugar mutase [Flavobacteriales bacterium]